MNAPYWNLLQALFDSVDQACSRECIGKEICHRLNQLRKTMEATPPPKGRAGEAFAHGVSSLARVLAEEAMLRGCSKSSMSLYTLSQQLGGGGGRLSQSLHLPPKRL